MRSWRHSGRERWRQGIASGLGCRKDMRYSHNNHVCTPLNFLYQFWSWLSEYRARRTEMSSLLARKAARTVLVSLPLLPDVATWNLELTTIFSCVVNKGSMATSKAKIKKMPPLIANEDWENATNALWLEGLKKKEVLRGFLWSFWCFIFLFF